MSFLHQAMSYLESPGTGSTLGSAFNVLCTVVGTGLLNLPFGGAQSGWIGVIFLIVLGVMACYTADLIVKCLPLIEKKELLALSKSSREVDILSAEGRPTVADNPEWSSVAPPRTYGDIGQAAFGSFGKWAVIVQMHLTLTMVATIYNLLGGLNLVAVLGWSESDSTYGILIISGIVWFHVFLKTLSEVAVVSYFNIVITFALEVVVIAVALMSPPAEPAHTTFVVPDVVSLGGAFASFAFAYGVHPILPTIYRNMRNPSQYRTMIVCAFAGVLLMYLPMLIVGYAVFGDAVKSPIYSVDTMKNNPWVKVVIALLTLHLIGAYAIVINPPERALETTIGIDNWSYPLFWRVLIRTGFVALTALVSITLGIQNFGPFLDLVSSFTSTFTQFIFPCLFYLKLTWDTDVKISKLEWSWNVLITAVALIGATFGTIGAVKELAKVFV